MHRQQLWIAVALILVEAGAFAYFTDSWVVPICVTVVSLLATTTIWRTPLIPQRRLLGAMALAIPFTVQWAFAPYEPSHLRTFILYSLAHAGGQYGLALQTGYLWTKRSEETWSAAFPVCGVCVLMAAGDVQTSHLQNIIFQAVVLAFILLTSAYFSSARIPLVPRRSSPLAGRLILSMIVVAITCIASIVGSRMLERSWSTIERLYTEWMLSGGQEGAAGFSRQAKLGSISERAGALDQVPVLRVYAKDEPGYLRGAAFDRYRGGNWLNDAPRTSAPPDAQPPKEIAGVAEYSVFHLPATTPSQIAIEGDARRHQTWEMIDVWPTGTLSGAIFAPLEARWLAVPQTNLVLDPHGIAYPDDLPPQTNYRSFISAYSSIHPRDGDDLQPATGTELEIASHNSALTEGLNITSLTSVPDDLDSRVRDLAKVILADCVTPEQKVVAVSSWFRKNYHYELGMKVPTGQDPLTHFLVRRPAAHCEYFASGTAILLRLGDVPCRYVTGFVSTEYNYLGGYWLVRNKDAHAWVEALLPGRGWIVVESTPSAGIPHSSHSIQPRHLWDDMVLRIQMLRSQILQGTWHGLWRAMQIVLSMLFTTPHGWLMLCGLVVWGIVLFRRHFHFKFKHRLDPISAEFRRLLNEMDRHLERISQHRQPHETLHQFAMRLEQSPEAAVRQVANWYRRYAELRYRPETRSEQISVLRSDLKLLTVDLRRVPKVRRK